MYSDEELIERILNHEFPPYPFDDKYVNVSEKKLKEFIEPYLLLRIYYDNLLDELKQLESENSIPVSTIKRLINCYEY
jgi:hypothetical protein